MSDINEKKLKTCEEAIRFAKENDQIELSVNHDLVLWEYQGKRICKFYCCSDLDGNQHPDCEEGIRPKTCELNKIQSLLDSLNEPREREDE